MAPAQTPEVVENGPVGPHPSYIQVAKPYIFEKYLQDAMTATGVTEAKEDTNRLQGIQWIDNATAQQDAAAAALFTACKIEDTLKRSREILCAAYNLKLSPAEQVSQDDPMFEVPSKSIIGLERLMLEASGFDFRNRYSQRLLLKIAKFYDVDKDTVGKTAYNMSLDLYRTFAPLKQTTQTMAIACVELAGRLHEQNIPELEAGQGYKKWRTSRAEVMETLLDLLDLYTHHRPSTQVGQDHSLESFIAIRITLNQEASSTKLPRNTNSSRRKLAVNGIKATNGSKDLKGLKSPLSPTDPLGKDNKASPLSPGTPGAQKTRAGFNNGTIRFMLDPQRARDEKNTVSEFFKVEEEEYEVEVERERERRR
ncbi:MAG: RNA polymerase II C-terminal domain kinase beta subunit [Icmadophila ericetorum]|nr:RNA polymerase II C-terminal domain kinase beta subunit [Icmadophila ericetorum]